MSEPYRFAIPPTWREGKIANIQSGNFCLVRPCSLTCTSTGTTLWPPFVYLSLGLREAQPRCDEPWTEALYENPSEGKLTVRTWLVLQRQ